jgi:hypothetical protein
MRDRDVRVGRFKLQQKTAASLFSFRDGFVEHLSQN